MKKLNKTNYHQLVHKKKIKNSLILKEKESEINPFYYCKNAKPGKNGIIIPI